MINIIFENDQYLIVNKGAKLVVNRSETVKEATLQDQLQSYLKLPKGDLGIGERAGIVHRLDRETSGLIVVAKTQKVFENLQEQFRNRLVNKEYIVLVHGLVKENEGKISIRVGRIGKFGKFGVVDRREETGRETETVYRVMNRLKFKVKGFANLVSLGAQSKVRANYLKSHGFFYTYLGVFPKTGRTHEIRVALKSIGHPVVSDLIYTPSKLLKFDLAWCPRLFLHAKKLAFRDPVSGKLVLYESPMPEDLKGAMLYLLTVNSRHGFK